MQAALIALSLFAAAQSAAAPQLRGFPSFFNDRIRITPVTAVLADGPRRVTAIRVEAIVDNDGRVVSARAVCCAGDPVAAAAEALVRTWRYNLAGQGGPQPPAQWRILEDVPVEAARGQGDAPFPAASRDFRIVLSTDGAGILSMGGPIGRYMEIDEQGNVLYHPGGEGFDFTPRPADRNPKRVNVGPEEAANLLAAFRAVGFYSLEPYYYRPVDHTPAISLTLEIDGRAMTVTDHGAAAPPQVLALQDTMEELARRALWPKPAEFSAPASGARPLLVQRPLVRMDATEAEAMAAYEKLAVWLRTGERATAPVLYATAWASIDYLPDLGRRLPEYVVEYWGSGTATGGRIITLRGHCPGDPVHTALRERGPATPAMLRLQGGCGFTARYDAQAGRILTLDFNAPETS